MRHTRSSIVFDADLRAQLYRCALAYYTQEAFGFEDASVL